MITLSLSESITRIAAEPPLVLHRKGSTDYPSPPFRAVLLMPDDSPDNYEELTEEQYREAVLAAYKEKEYARRLAAAIHRRYSLDDEIALAANVGSVALLSDAPDSQSYASEYAAYQKYRNLCKMQVRAEVDAISELPADFV